MGGEVNGTEKLHRKEKEPEGSGPKCIDSILRGDN